MGVKGVANILRGGGGWPIPLKFSRRSQFKACCQTTDASLYISGKGKKLVTSSNSFFNADCLKPDETRLSPRLYSANGACAKKRRCPDELQLCRFSTGK